MNWKILHVKDTDWSNQVGSEIDSEVKIFDIFCIPVQWALFQRASFIFSTIRSNSCLAKENFIILRTSIQHAKAFDNNTCHILSQFNSAVK